MLLIIDAKFDDALFLTSFFGIVDARELLIIDAKFDEALFLWLWFLLKFRRPNKHNVQITVFVVGIQDLAAGVALVRHLFPCAQEGEVEHRDAGH